MWTEQQIEAMAGLGITLDTLPACALETDVETDTSAHAGRDDRSDLSEAEFELLRPVLPAEPSCQTALSNKTVVDALVWCLQTGRRMTQLPARYGSAEAVRKRAER